MKGLPAAALPLALGVVARANLGPVEHQNLALSPGNINSGPLGAMHEDMGVDGSMHERNYFEAPPYGAGAFSCRFEPVLFSMTHLAQSCRLPLRLRDSMPNEE
jgi:hypothetical protein